MARSSLKNNDLTSIDQLNPSIVKRLFDEADGFKKKSAQNDLKNKIIALLFFEPSSRTFSSFNVAVKRLGGNTLEYQNPKETSSLVKGESFSDMIKVFSSYSDAIVIRHPEKGFANLAAEASGVPVINAGDGIGEHPSQALLDFFTISSKHRRTKKLKGLIVGDLVNGRTVHSLLKILAMHEQNEIYLLSPKNLALGQEEIEKFSGKLKISLIYSEKDIPKDLDFWYWTRIQKERMKIKQKNEFILRNDLITKYAGKNTLFMHPLPRVGEILEEVDQDLRAVYLNEQIKNGMYIRMAILSEILK